MEIVISQSEQRLLEMLSIIQQAPDQWMSLHIHLSPLHEQMLDQEDLSKVTLDKIRSISTQIAEKLNEIGLEAFEGNILVFEDGDVLALYVKDPAAEEEMLRKLRREFNKNNLINVLAIEEIKKRVNVLTLFSKEKIKSANEYRIKQYAVELGEKIAEWPKLDVKMTHYIQKKRRSRTSNCVLVIEDDVLIRGLMNSMLKDEYRVIQAKDAASGITAYCDRAPNVVFLDINMPGLNGQETLIRLLQLDPEAYIIMLSGYGSADNVMGAVANGAIGFVGKPFSKEKLRTYMKKCPSLQ